MLNFAPKIWIINFQTIKRWCPCILNTLHKKRRIKSKSLQTINPNLLGNEFIARYISWRWIKKVVFNRELCCCIWRWKIMTSRTAAMFQQKAFFIITSCLHGVCPYIYLVHPGQSMILMAFVDNAVCGTISQQQVGKYFLTYYEEFFRHLLQLSVPI